MNILVCGACGFIGEALCERLESSGHRVLRGVRHAKAPGDLEIDYTRDLEPAQWEARLRGVDVVIDAVINAVGILVERRGQTFDAVHTNAPIALFDACHRLGVSRIIQMSALGAHSGTTPYFRSKRVADDYLQSLPVSSRIVRPALVYGERGASASFFRMLASLPLHFLPAGGNQRLRPVHVDELTEVVDHLLSEEASGSCVVDVVGGEEVAYREMLAIYRASLGFGRARQLSIPGWLIGAAATVLGRFPAAILTRDTWTMLQTGSTGDPAETAALLGRQPASLRRFVDGNTEALRYRALSAWRSPLLRGVLALVWLWTVVASVFLYPRDASLALLDRAHLHGNVAVAAFWLAAMTDLVFGILTIVRPGRWLWLSQAALIAAYSLIIAFTMPEMLWHPFGAILKNLPILAILLILFSEETSR